MNLHRLHILELLRDLDCLLNAPIELVLCGGAAGILLESLDRATLDIDVVESSVNLSGLNDPIREVAGKHGISSEWINFNASRFLPVLPEDFRSRLKPIEAGFRFLRVFVISRGDLVLMKLWALRPEDLKDFESMSLNSSDLASLCAGLDRLRSLDPNRFHLVRSLLNERGLL